MEITPSSSTPRTTKVRTTKPAVPKSSAPAKPAVAAKTVADKLPSKPKTKPKAAAGPRKRKAVTAPTAEPVPVASDLTPMIATAAYYLAEQRQFAPGYEMVDWLAAEQLIRDGMHGK